MIEITEEEYRMVERILLALALYGKDDDFKEELKIWRELRKRQKHYAK